MLLAATDEPAMLQLALPCSSLAPECILQLLYASCSLHCPLTLSIHSCLCCLAGLGQLQGTAKHSS